MRLLARLPGWGVPLAIFVISRLVDVLVIAHGAHLQVAQLGTEGNHIEVPKPAHPGYWAALSNWDGQWYETIARHGYPRSIPASGPVPQNPWAFYPLYPMLVRAVMIITRLNFAPAASVVSMVFAALAMVLIHRMVLDRGGRFAAAITVLALCVFPSAPILQTAYTEGLALFAIALLVWSLTRREYAAVWGALVMLALTRPIVIAAAPVIALHGVLRWRELTRRQRWTIGALAVAAAVLVLLWPAVAAVVTGRHDAYFATQKAWSNELSLQRSYLGWLFGGPDRAATITAVLALLVLVVGLVIPAGRVLPIELRIWAGIYALYLAFTLRPTTSIERYLLLTAAPWLPVTALAPAGTRKWVCALAFGAVALVGIRLQVGWVEHYFIPRADWLLPP